MCEISQRHTGASRGGQATLERVEARMPASRSDPSRSDAQAVTREAPPSPLTLPSRSAALTLRTHSAGPSVPSESAGPTVPSESAGPTVPTQSAGPILPAVSRLPPFPNLTPPAGPAAQIRLASTSSQAARSSQTQREPARASSVAPAQAASRDPVARQKEAVREILRAAVNEQGNYGGKHQQQIDRLHQWIDTRVLGPLYQSFFDTRLRTGDFNRGGRERITSEVRAAILKLFAGDPVQPKLPKFMSE